jgi:hypothetical protein
MCVLIFWPTTNSLYRESCRPEKETLTMQSFSRFFFLSLRMFQDILAALHDGQPDID